MRAGHLKCDIIKRVICNFKKIVLKSSPRAGLKVNHRSYFVAHTKSMTFCPMAELF